LKQQKGRNEMTNQVTAFAILQAIKSADCAISPQRICADANIDPTSENLMSVRDECFDFVEAGKCVYYDLRKEIKNPGLFFSLV
jgi:hypothetical protein